MKMLLLPLDERPCNYMYPLMIAESGDVDLVLPDRNLLGNKKDGADTDALASFLIDEAPGCDAAIISVDMLIYGGLVPSRIHHMGVDVLMKRLGILSKLKELNPLLHIYAFASILRCPSYDSDEEEPDYYARYGHELFRRAYLMDLSHRIGLKEDQQMELDNITLPDSVLCDYEDRRRTNLQIDKACMELVTNGIADYLMFPQDDSSQYGYTAGDQSKLRYSADNLKLGHRVVFHPGADEAGLTLIARAYCRLRSISPLIHARFASTLGPQIIPSYEDRPMYESLKSHVAACGARLCLDNEEADIELMVNCPGRIMQEAGDAEVCRDPTYDTFRDLSLFADCAVQMIEDGKKVAVCDAAYGNGGDMQFVELLDEEGILPEVFSYAGWNTYCNALGTTLSQAIVGSDGSPLIKKNLAYRIIEDALYQAHVRWVIDSKIEQHGGSYQDVCPCLKWACRTCRDLLNASYCQMNMSRLVDVHVESVVFPWSRLFEVSFQLVSGGCNG